MAADEPESELSDSFTSCSDASLDPTFTANEVIEDLTNEAGLDSVAQPSSSSPIIGPVTIKPRPYQTEMVEESLRRNIIVAVS